MHFSLPFNCMTSFIDTRMYSILRSVFDTSNSRVTKVKKIKPTNPYERQRNRLERDQKDTRSHMRLSPDTAPALRPLAF